ncbi:leucine/isoleucine/valine transporter permease subunit [bacterium BMS3Abin02]|nr:leucine/isoleucine/valine transporter permease subunit [bacterium BMS3Abin02]
MNTFSRRRMGEAVRTWLLLTALLAVVALVGSAFLDAPSQRVLTNFLTIVGLVVAYQSFVGPSGLLSFGHVAFFGAGAYAAALVTIPVDQKARLLQGLPAWLAGMETGLWGAILAAVLVAAIIAAFTGATISKMEDMGLVMATLALLVMMYTVFANWDTVTRGTIGILRVPDLVTTPIALVAAVVITGVALLFSASPIGLRLQAVREDQAAASALGISVARSRFYGWMISAVLMGAGAAVWALNNLAFGPHQFFFAQTFTLLSMLVIGGMSSVSGAVIGTAVVTVLAEMLRPLERGLSLGPVHLSELPGVIQLALAALIMLVLIVAPQGITGGRELGSLLRRRK